MYDSIGRHIPMQHIGIDLGSDTLKNPISISFPRDSANESIFVSAGPARDWERLFLFMGPETYCVQQNEINAPVQQTFGA
jgi:hypothetical protein